MHGIEDKKSNFILFSLSYENDLQTFLQIIIFCNSYSIALRSFCGIMQFGCLNIILPLTKNVKSFNYKKCGTCWTIC